jgi:hypothetical protein
LVNTQERNTRNPFMQTSEMLKMFESLPDGSQEKIALGGILDNTFAGGLFPRANSRTAKNAAPVMNGTFPGLGAPWQRDPRFGSTRGGAGGTYTNQNTGEIVSTDTNTQASRDQRTIAGTENVKQYVGEIRKNLPQFQTLTSRLNVGREGLSNFVFNTDYKGPSQLAMGDAALKASAEGFINTFGLNATEGNVNTTIGILKPHFGESPKGYDERVTQQLSDLVAQERRAQQRLAQGNSVGQGEPAQQGYFSRLAVGGNPEQAPAQQQMDLNAMAEEAIARGANPEAVRARMAELQGSY